MQKSKSFQKVNKSSKQASNSSSRALLQLSEITAHSKDKSSLLQNFTERSGYPSITDKQHSVGQITCTKPKQKAKSYSKKQTYLKKNVSLSNTVLNQIMELSNSLQMKNSNFESSRQMQKNNDLIVLSKSNLQKNKNFSQAKKNKKLILYENKQNQQRTMSKSNSYYAQTMKGESVLCSIKIHPLEEQKSNQHFTTSQKRESFQGRRNSFNSSRRSSIHQLNQTDPYTQAKMREVRKSFLAKISLVDNNKKGPDEESVKKDNFLKQSNTYFEQNLCSQFKNTIEKKTCQNQTEITPRQRKQLKEKYLLKIDQLNLVEEDIKKDVSKFAPIWDRLIQSEQNLKNYKKSFAEVKKSYEKLANDSNMLKNLLFEQNKRYVLCKRMSNNNFNVQKQSILLQVERIHSDVKKKVFKKDLEQMMIFNMKVVLPTSQMLESSISCFDNRINSSLNYSNITVLQLYEELMNQKASKKYGMILKKEINNMNIYDNRTMNEYLKKLYELQSAFNRVLSDDPQNEIEYLDKIEDLVEKIEQTDQELASVKRNYSDLQYKIQVYEKVKTQSTIQLQNLLNEISEIVYQEYKMFQTGGKPEFEKTRTTQVQPTNQSFTQIDKTIQEFRDLVTKKYDDILNRYKDIKEEKKMILTSLKANE